MRRSSRRIWARSAAVAVVALAMAAAVAGPVSAGQPRGPVTGGGDDPSVVERQSPEEIAITQLKLQEAGRLRAAVAASLRLERRSAGQRRGAHAGPRPSIAENPCEPDCPPVAFVLESNARQQNNWYYCGPAVAQVIINRSREVYAANVDGEKAATNYRRQSVIGGFMGTTSAGSTAWMIKSGLNQYADLAVSGRNLPFTVLEDISSGSQFHWAMILATWGYERGAGVPVEMVFDGQHLVSWTSGAWWNNHKTTTVRHWISVYGYDGFWDGTSGPQLFFTDSSGGLGGQTGNFQNASRMVYNLNQANSARIVY